jgi:hypothetical protein
MLPPSLRAPPMIANSRTPRSTAGSRAMASATLVMGPVIDE